MNARPAPCRVSRRISRSAAPGDRSPAAPRMDIAVGGRGMIRGDPESDDFSRLGRRLACAHRPANLFPSLNTWSAASTATTASGSRSAPMRRRADRGGAIAPSGSSRIVASPPISFNCSATRNRYSKSAITTAASNGGSLDHADDRLKCRPVPDERNELLGQAFPRFRPHAGAGPAAHDHRLYLGHSFPGFAARHREPRLLCNNGGFKSMPSILAAQSRLARRSPRETIEADHPRRSGCHRQRQREGAEAAGQRQSSAQWRRS